MSRILEYKDINTGVVKDVDVKNRVVIGYLSAFGNVDRNGEIMAKGAFTKSLNERRNEIFFLNNHNFAQPHGKFAVLKEDDYGLYFESEPLIDTTYSMDTLKLYEAGIIDKHSVGYVVQKSKRDYEREGDVKQLTEVMLFEGSNVTLPANAGAGLLGLKSLSFKEIKKKSELISKMLANGNVTDETFKLLEIGLMQLETEAFNLGVKTALNGIEPSYDTRDDVKPLVSIIENFKF